MEDGQKSEGEKMLYLKRSPVKDDQDRNDPSTQEVLDHRRYRAQSALQSRAGEEGGVEVENMKASCHDPSRLTFLPLLFMGYRLEQT